MKNGIQVTNGIIRASGYERDAGPGYDARAVRWWVFYAEKDGFVFARGGRVRTARVARHTIGATVALCIAEKVAYDRRPTQILAVDGSLREIVR